MMAKNILRFTQDMAAAEHEVTQLGGRITQQFSPTVFVAEVPDATDEAAMTASTGQPAQALDEASQLAVDAWNSGVQARGARAGQARSATEGLTWDTPGYQPPRELDTLEAGTRAAGAPEAPAESTGTPTSRYMIGSVAVGVVLVSRNTGAEVLSAAERTKIIQEVQEGLGWLAGVEPRARVSFVYDIRNITVTSAPGPYAGVADAYERYERDWRDAALASMGYAAGRAGYQKYASDLRASRHTDWAYVAFFTKYPLNHFAYAIVEKVVMNYANDGWGPDNLNRVFAHESCHIFGAADEYGSCACGATSGHLAVPNSNCVNCFPPGTQLSCLMNANTLDMCTFSRQQIGWDERLFPRQVGWSGWVALGAPPVGFSGAPAVVSRNGTVCNLYARGADNALWQKALFNNAWHDWGRHNDGGVLASEPALGSMGPDHEHVFVRGTDNQVWQKFWKAASGWSGWFALGAPPAGFTGAPAVVSRNGSVCNIYVRGNDNALWQKAWFNNAWHDWARHNDGGVLASEPALGTMGPDHEHVFVRGTDNQVWQKWWTGAGGWSGWVALGAPPGGFTGAPSVISRNGSVCNLYVRGADNALWQRAYWNNAWHGWGRHNDGGVLASEPALGTMGPDHEHVFVRGTDNQVWQKWWQG
ncbi:MAG: hypothetical protein JWP77_965 [Polaromonas sp.]|nr:hypothetical protein [Polaromonas sp.]MDB5938601.1 hypothetical protein [Polaromonas sp.]